MLKLLPLLLIPFFLIACDEEDDDSVTVQITRFEQASKQNKIFFKDDRKAGLDSYLRFAVDTVNDRVTMTEYLESTDSRGPKYKAQDPITFFCDSSQCKSSEFEDSFETIVIDPKLTEVLVSKYLIVNEKNELKTRTRYVNDENPDEENFTNSNYDYE